MVFQWNIHVTMYMSEAPGTSKLSKDNAKQANCTLVLKLSGKLPRKTTIITTIIPLLQPIDSQTSPTTLTINFLASIIPE